jgi:predicted methyltransferase
MYDQSKLSELIRFARVDAGSTVIDVYNVEAAGFLSKVATLQTQSITVYFYVARRTDARAATC